MSALEIKARNMLGLGVPFPVVAACLGMGVLHLCVLVSAWRGRP